MAAVGLIRAAGSAPPPFNTYKGDAAGGHFGNTANVMEDTPWSKALAGWWTFKILIRKKILTPNKSYIPCNKMIGILPGESSYLESSRKSITEAK